MCLDKLECSKLGTMRKKLAAHGSSKMAVMWLFFKSCIFSRQLSHPNIVKFYGTNLQRGRNGTTVVIILELCSCSLSYHVMSHPEEAQARLPKEAVVKKVLGWALNILDALRYIHGKRFAHRNLKLDKILVSWWNDDSHIPFFFFSETSSLKHQIFDK